LELSKLQDLGKYLESHFMPFLLSLVSARVERPVSVILLAIRFTVTVGS
jgi:hypothetical protein